MIGGTEDDIDADRIRAEAAEWVVKSGARPPSGVNRGLQAWLAADPRHAAAFHRIGQRFEGARILRSSRRYGSRPQAARRSGRITVAAGVLAVAAVLLLLLLPIGLLPSRDSPDRPVAALIPMPSRPSGSAQQVHASGGAARSIGLADGSVITLDASSVVEVSLTSAARQITLVRGRARFTVTHDGRPFTVIAGGGSVTARGTVFDVALTSAGKVTVTLLHGIVDVAPVTHSRIGGERSIRRLLAGQMIDYDQGFAAEAVPTTAPLDHQQWADGAVDFDNVSLSYLLDRANQAAAKQIRLADPDLATLRVSGRFDIGDTDRLSQNLARLFDLRADLQAGVIVLHRP